MKQENFKKAVELRNRISELKLFINGFNSLNGEKNPFLSDKHISFPKLVGAGSLYWGLLDEGKYSMLFLKKVAEARSLVIDEMKKEIDLLETKFSQL